MTTELATRAVLVTEAPSKSWRLEGYSLFFRLRLLENNPPLGTCNTNPLREWLPDRPSGGAATPPAPQPKKPEPARYQSLPPPKIDESLSIIKKNPELKVLLLFPTI